MYIAIPTPYPSMILLEKQCVSLELAKRLKELGAKQESVWAWYETTENYYTHLSKAYDQLQKFRKES